MVRTFLCAYRSVQPSGACAYRRHWRSGTTLHRLWPTCPAWWHRRFGPSVAWKTYLRSLPGQHLLTLWIKIWMYLHTCLATNRLHAILHLRTVLLLFCCAVSTALLFSYSVISVTASVRNKLIVVVNVISNSRRAFHLHVCPLKTSSEPGLMCCCCHLISNIVTDVFWSFLIVYTSCFIFFSFCSTTAWRQFSI